MIPPTGFVSATPGGDVHAGDALVHPVPPPRSPGPRRRPRPPPAVSTCEVHPGLTRPKCEKQASRNPEALMSSSVFQADVTGGLTANPGRRLRFSIKKGAPVGGEQSLGDKMLRYCAPQTGNAAGVRRLQDRRECPWCSWTCGHKQCLDTDTCARAVPLHSSRALQVHPKALAPGGQRHPEDTSGRPAWCRKSSGDLGTQRCSHQAGFGSSLQTTGPPKAGRGPACQSQGTHP